MRIRLFHILTSLFFCVGSAILLAESAQYGLWLSIGISLVLSLVQRGVWRLGPGKACISYSLAFLPSCLFEVGVVRSCPMLYVSGIVYIAVCALIPSEKLPVPRPSTSLWIGSLIFLVEVSVLAGVLSLR